MKTKLFSIFLLILVIATGTISAQDKQDWKFMHPLPHASIVRKIKMLSETEWVAAGAFGLFMHSSNSGANWYYHYAAGRVSATTGTANGNTDLWFFNSNTGIVVGDQGYIGRTTNGGISFDSVNTVSGGLLNLNQACIDIWFADANTGYIGAGSQTAFTTRILKTTNAGLNWSVVFNDNTGSTSYLTALGGFDNQNVCAAWANGTCLRTTNGGTNWVQQTSTFTTLMKNFGAVNATTGFCAGSGGTVSLTTNAGANWTALTPVQVDWSYFQVKVVSASEVYLVGDASFLYKSTNLGTNWTALPISVSGPAITFVWYGLDFSGSTYVLSGDYGIIGKSTDGAATWTSNSYQLGNQIMSDITTVSGTSKYWAVGRAFPFGSTTKQIMYSSNSGANWTTYSLGTTGDLQAITMLNETTGYASGTNNQVFKTVDGGVTWIPKTSPSPVPTSQLFSSKFIDENTGWCFVNFSTVAGGNVFKTTNGGNNWSQYSTGDASENIYSSDMVDANTGYCVMNFSGRPIYKTTNGGVNWTAIPTAVSGLTTSVHGVSAPDANTVYACQAGGTQRVSKSTNGGANWTLLTLPAVADFTFIKFKDANTGYVAGNSTALICKTTNGGANWTFQHTHNITLGKVYVTQGDTAWALGGSEAIFRNTGSPTKIKLNLGVSMEGMLNPGTNELSRNDTVKVYLRNGSTPYAIVDSAKAVINKSTLQGSYTFPTAVSGVYYIESKYWNCIETWSKNPVALIADGSTTNYDFTTANTQAYGNNEVMVGTKWCNFSGDVNNSGGVDFTDVISISNDGTSFASGYIITDLNGDNVVNFTDLIFSYNNSTMFVIAKHP